MLYEFILAYYVFIMFSLLFLFSVNKNWHEKYTKPAVFIFVIPTIIAMVLYLVSLYR